MVSDFFFKNPLRLKAMEVRRTALLKLAHRMIDKRPDDQYIAAHQRSGSTWLRTILVNLLRPETPGNPDVFQFLIPIVRLGMIPVITRLSSPRILMTHSWYREDIPRVVYLVRDGRDSIVSFYHFLIDKQKRDQVQDFGDFLDRYLKMAYGYTWHHNVETWLGPGRARLGQHLLFVRFEDIKAQTEQKVKEIASFLNISCTSEQIQVAVQEASLDKMRQVEQKQMGHLSNPNQSFYRKGSTGGWQEYFTPALEQQFYRVAGQAMKLAGYA
jgi:hypothetical protein